MSSAETLDAADRDRPDLPAGYVAQETSGFTGGAGLFRYWFNRVYGPVKDIDGRGPFQVLIEDLSYWSVTWEVAGKMRARWLTYAGLRERGGSRMSFARFSSALGLADELPALLGVTDAA